MPFDLDQLEFLRVSVGVAIPPEFLENKRREVEFKTRQEKIAASGSGNPDAKVSVRLSFIDRKGRYCRAFESTGQAGLACRDGATWQVQALVSAPAGSPPGAGMRQAASPLPPALLGEIDQRIAGEPLNAAAEQEARRKGWQR